VTGSIELHLKCLAVEQALNVTREAPVTIAVFWQRARTCFSTLEFWVYSSNNNNKDEDDVQTSCFTGIYSKHAYLGLQQRKWRKHIKSATGHRNATTCNTAPGYATTRYAAACRNAG
jgi:hypothetical protein